MAAVALVVVALDQLSKGALRSALEPGEHRDLVLGFELSYVTNSGIAFGLLSEGANGVVLAVTLGRAGAGPRLVRDRPDPGPGSGSASGCWSAGRSAT